MYLCCVAVLAEPAERTAPAQQRGPEPPGSLAQRVRARVYLFLLSPAFTPKPKIMAQQLWVSFTFLLMSAVLLYDLLKTNIELNGFVILTGGYIFLLTIVSGLKDGWLFTMPHCLNWYIPKLFVGGLMFIVKRATRQPQGNPANNGGNQPAVVAVACAGVWLAAVGSIIVGTHFSLVFVLKRNGLM